MQKACNFSVVEVRVIVVELIVAAVMAVANGVVEEEEEVTGVM